MRLARWNHPFTPHHDSYAKLRAQVRLRVALHTQLR